MANCMITLGIMFIASMVRPLEAIPPVSLERLKTMLSYCREFILHPLRTFQSLYIRELNYILEIKQTNDWHELSGTDALFANLTSAADAISREILKKDAELNSTVGSDIDKKETAECKEMFLTWKRIGIKLWDSYHECRADGMANATMYEGNLRRSEHIFRDLESFRDMFQDCMDMDEFFFDYGSLVCTLRVQFESIFFIVSLGSDMDTYVNASMDLMKLKKEIGSHERCVDIREMEDFYERAKTIIFETKNCVYKSITNVPNVIPNV